MSSLLLLFAGLFLPSTSAFYHVFRDTTGTSSYMAQISQNLMDSFDLILYKQSPYASSPICTNCIIFNGTLETHNIPLSQDTVSFRIQTSKNIHLFIHCPLLLTITISLPSKHIQYTHINTPNLSNNGDNTAQFHCVFQKQSLSDTNTIHYIMYNKANTNSLSLYQYHIPLHSNQLIQSIPTPLNASLPYILYTNDIYFISLSHSPNTLNIYSYNCIDKTWRNIGDTFSDITLNPTLTIKYAGIHDTQHSTMPILNIFLHSDTISKYEIVSYLLNTDIHSIHEYTYNKHNSDPIIINDDQIHFILSPITDNLNHFIYYSHINTFLKHISYTAQHMHSAYTKRRRRRLQKSDPECRDSSDSCALVAHDCDDEGITDLCRNTCNQCQQLAFNCSDYKPTSQTIDVCDYPRKSPSFCNDPNQWFLYFCPITCKHPNCSSVWMTANPTYAPSVMTTVFESTESIPTNRDVSTRAVSDRMRPIPIEKDTIENDMSLILILLAVLLVCVFVAGVLLWLCTNIVKLQRDRNTMVYNTMVAMSSRTDYIDYGHPDGKAPSTPDYFRTTHRHTHRDPVRG